MASMPEVQMPEKPATLVRYIVTVRSPKGTFDLEIPTFQGPDVAGRRAIVSLAALGKGDLDDTEILSITEGTFETVDSI